MRFTALLMLLAGCATPRVVWVGRDPERHVRVELVSTGKAQWLRIGDAEGERFDSIGAEGLVFAADGATLAYPAMRGGQWFMVRAKNVLGPYESISEPRFSPTGTRLAFIAQLPGGFYAVVDGELSKAFERIQPGTLTFSANADHFGFVASNGACALTVIDGKESGCRQRIRALRLADDGTPVVLVREDGKDRLIHKELSPPYDEITEWRLAENGRLAYAARTGSRWTVVGAEPNDCARAQHLRFGNQGARFAFVCWDDGAASVIADGAKGKPFPSISAPILASNATDLGYLARDERGAWAVINDVIRGPYSQAVDLVLAKNGNGSAFIERSGGITRIVHNGASQPFEAIVEGTLVISDDGSHWAAITGLDADQSLWITIDGKRTRRLVAAEVFGNTTVSFEPWLERELRQARGEPK